MTVAQALSELLYEHDAVTVPGLGTFLCDYESAKVNVITNHFERPSATVVFDGQQREENDVLVRHLMASDGCTEEEARQQVTRFVADCFAELKAGREVTLPGIGTLCPDAERAVGFVAEASNYNGDAFGLTDFDPEPVFGGTPAVDWRAQVARQLKDQNTPMTVDAKAVHEEDYGDEQRFAHQRRRRVLAGVLTALLLVVAVVLLLYFMEVIHFDLPVRLHSPATPPVATQRVPVPDSAMQALLVRYEPMPAALEESVAETAVDSTEVAAEAAAGPVADTAVAATHEPPTPAASETPAQPSTPVTQPEAPAPTASGSDILPIAEMQPYAIIAGCFSQQANAENYLKPIQEQGYPKAFLMQKNGMYYVCYGQYATLDDAKAAHADILANANKKAWILTK